MSIFGEFNVFRPEEAKGMLTKARCALIPNGLLLLEPHTFEKVVEVGRQPSSWYAAEKGLFSDKPHLYLQENFWDADAHVAIQRYYIINAATGDVTRHASSMQAYTNEAYQSLLAECRFGAVEFYPALGEGENRPHSGLLGILAQNIGSYACMF